MTDQKSQDGPRATERWVEVLAPSYTIIEPENRSQKVPRWIERMNEGKLPAKDRTNAR